MSLTVKGASGVLTAAGAVVSADVKNEGVLSLPPLAAKINATTLLAAAAEIKLF